VEAWLVLGGCVAVLALMLVVARFLRRVGLPGPVRVDPVVPPPRGDLDLVRQTWDQVGDDVEENVFPLPRRLRAVDDDNGGAAA
jgi:hypothetical protein